MSRKIYNRLSLMAVSWLDESTLGEQGGEWFSGRACVKEGAEVAGGNMRREREYGFTVSRLVLLLAVFVVGAGVTAENVAPLNAQTAGQPTDKTIVVFGQSIHYWDVGSGPVVVLVHGLGSRKEDWLPVLEPLAQKYRLLVPDQVGFGKSDKPLLDYSVQTYVDFLNEF